MTVVCESHIMHNTILKKMCVKHLSIYSLNFGDHTIKYLNNIVIILTHNYYCIIPLLYFKRLFWFT